MQSRGRAFWLENKSERDFLESFEEADEHEKCVFTFQSQKWNKKWNKPLLPRRTSFSASRGGGAETFFGLFPLVYERKTLEMSLWPAETRTLPLRTFRFRGMIIVHRFQAQHPSRLRCGVAIGNKGRARGDASERHR